MHGNEDLFLQQISPFLGTYFLSLAIINGLAAFYCWHTLNRNRLALAWLALSLVLLILAPFAYSGVNGDVMCRFNGRIHVLKVNGLKDILQIHI